MADVLELAKQLGKAVAESDQAKRLRKAEETLNADGGLMQTLKDYRGQVEKIAELEQSNSPVEVEDKHRLEQLQGELYSADAFKEYTAAQAEFADLMRKVNQAIQSEMAG